jgi:ABC-2 family transporter protein
VNTTLVLHLLVQRFTSPARLVFLAFIAGFPLLILLAVPATGLTAVGTAINIVLVLAAGMIGQDVSSGVLQLLLVRPIRRWEYVVSRWLAVAFASLGVALLQLACAWAILALRGYAPEPRAVGELAVAHLIVSFGGAATFTLLSALVTGLGDLGIWAVGAILAQATQGIGQMMQRPWVTRGGHELERLLSPAVDIAALFGRAPFPWYDAAAVVSNLAVCLVLAILLLNRKELSYASG